MRHDVLAVAVVLLLPVWSGALDEHPGNDTIEMDAALPPDLPIKITINPEARVSVLLAGALPPAARCGTTVDLPVKIINQGFFTGRLEAELVDDQPAGVTLDFHPPSLTRVSQELRTLGITLTKPGLTDLTIAFRAHNETHDLGGRDRIHFLMRCR